MGRLVQRYDSIIKGCFLQNALKYSTEHRDIGVFGNGNQIIFLVKRYERGSFFIFHKFLAVCMSVECKDTDFSVFEGVLAVDVDDLLVTKQRHHTIIGNVNGIVCSGRDKLINLYFVVILVIEEVSGSCRYSESVKRN